MNSFFWSAGHLGWGLFAALVFSTFVWIAMDLLWRLLKLPIRQLGIYTVTGWVLGVVLIVLGFLSAMR